jgi:hypothetical protein
LFKTPSGNLSADGCYRATLGSLHWSLLGGAGFEPMLVNTDVREAFETGWLTGLIDGEGFVHVHYRKNRDTTHPRMRIYSTTKGIIDEACRIMKVNPYARNDHGKISGWYAQVSDLKAVRILQVVGPHLTEPSKKCRAMTILRVFRERGSIRGRHPSAEVFVHCPPPTRLRSPRKL